MIQVAIIGGGLAGPLLALSLHKRNLSTAIFEARPEDYVHGGNIALAPNALRVLDHLGLYEALRIQGYNYEEIAFANASGTELGRFRNGSRLQYNFSALRIHRSNLRDELMRRVKQAGIPIQWNKKCVGVVSETAATKEDEGSATVKFEDGETVTAQFIVAADGIHSKLRHFVVPNAGEPTFSGQMGIGALVNRDDLGDGVIPDALHLPCMLFGANGSFAIMPSSFDGRELGYFTTLESDDKGREGFAKLGQNGEQLKSMLTERYVNGSHWLELVKRLCERSPSDKLNFWPFYTLPHIDSWTSPRKRVILIGDAAHAIPPTGGQGAAMAFEDAETLAHILDRAFSSVFTQAKDLPQLLVGWEQHRMKRIEQVLAFTTRGGAVRKSNLTLLEQTAKEWLLWLAFKWMGPDGGAKWLYEYNTESVLADIPSVVL